MLRFKKCVFFTVLVLALCAVIIRKINTLRHNNELDITDEKLQSQQKGGGKTFHHVEPPFLKKPYNTVDSLLVSSLEQNSWSLKPNSFFHTPTTSQVSQAPANREEKTVIFDTTFNTWKRTVDFVNVSEIYVYGAYLDHREGNKMTVHMLALQHRDNKDSLLCRIMVDDKVFNLYSEPYKMCENHGKIYEGWIYSCKLPTNVHKVPSQISILALSQRLNADKFITAPLKTIPQQTESDAKNIGVCVPPLFGNVNLSLVINFVEMCKLLGADQVMLYFASTSKEIRKFLEHHSKRDAALSLISWNMPREVTKSPGRIWYHGQLLAIQDCLYHNMGKFKFLLFMDLDEMLFPRKSYNWIDMLNSIIPPEDKEQVAAISFKSVFFDPQHPPEENEKILYFQHLLRAHAISTVRSKLMVQPLKVFELGIHHLSKAVSEKYRTLEVSQNQALIHHYNACVQTYEPSMKCYPTVKDPQVLRYKEKLTYRTHLVLTDALKMFA